MTIQPVTIHGQRRWRVDLSSPAGRVRRFFRTREEAERHAAERREELERFGAAFAHLTAAERVLIAGALERLSAAGATLPEAVDYYLEHHHPDRIRTVLQVFEEFLQAKTAAGCRPRYLKSLRYGLNSLVAKYGAVNAAAVRPADIDAWLGNPEWAAWTRRSHRTDAQTLFSFAIKRGYCSKNPVSATERPLLEDKPPGILTPVQCRDLLEAARKHTPRFLPAIAIMLFAGVRLSEVLRLQDAEIGAQYLEVKGHKSKTRARRLVTVCPALKAWLRVRRGLDFRNWRKLWDLAREKAGLLQEWKHDALRHSFVSYHLALHQSAEKTALEAGHSPQILFQHYRELVTKQQAREFFAIRP